jgi:hypothetical protein
VPDVGTTEANSRGLSNAVANADRWWEETKRECHEWVQELTLMQTWGFDLYQAIVGPPKVRGHLSKGMWIVAVHHTEDAE